MNYVDAVDLLARGRSGRKKIGNNTWLEKREGDVLALRLHGTDVVTLCPDGQIVLDSGGWKTVTTKDRLNSLSPARIHSEQGIWYVTYRDRVYVFKDGMVLHPDGTVTGAGEDRGREEKRLRQAAAKYAKGFAQAWAEGKVPTPSARDCLYCHMREVGTKKPLGEMSPESGKDHILAHIKEKYYVPSLLWRAVELYGAPVDKWSLAGEKEGFLSKEMMIPRLKRYILKHVRRQLGLA